MEVAKNVQFGIHTLSAFLALGIVVLLRNQGALIPSQGGLLAFTLVQLNPILLSCSRQILTDSICVLFVTLFCYAILSRKTWMWGIGGISLGVAALVRPFYLNFALAVAVSAALYTFLRNRGSSYLIFNRRMGTRVLLIIECFAMIISIQYIVVYRYTNLWAFVGPEAKQSINVHYRASIYSYKYETYIGVEPHRAPLHYSSTTRRSLLPEGVSKEFRFPDWCRVMLGDPAGTLAMIMIKTTGLFQSYEWSPFRQTLKLNARHPAFICGLILFIGFVFIVIVYVADKNWLNTGLRSQLSFDFLFIISTLHIFIYSILTAPESRFIYPVVPILSVCAIHAGCLGRKKSYMVYAMIISVVLYSVTYQIMRDSQM